MNGKDRSESNPPAGAPSIGAGSAAGGPGTGSAGDGSAGEGRAGEGGGRARDAEPDRWTGFYRRTPEYFRRLHDKAVREWRKPPPALEELPRSGLFLDVGSGAGLLCALAARGGAVAVGLDVSLEGARAGCALAGRHRIRGGLFVVGDAHSLPFRDGAFDAAAHYATLEHLVDPRASLREAARVLRPGGRLILFTVNALYPPRWRPSLLNGLLASAAAAPGREVEPLRRREFRGPDEAAWRAGACLDTWRVPAPVARRLARSFLEEERYETFHLCREGRVWLDEELRVSLERPPLFVRAARRAYMALNRVPLLRHLGPVVLWVGRKAPRSGTGRAGPGGGVLRSRG